MPVKRGNGGRRGANKGPERGIKKRQSDNGASGTIHKHKSAATSFLAKLAEFTFSSIVYTAYTFNIIPMNYENGVCSLTAAKFHKLFHYSILFFLFARIANVIYICSSLLFEDFNITTLMSLTILTCFLFTASLGCCSVLIIQDTVQVVNTWRQVLGIIEDVGGRQVGMFDGAMMSMKIIAVGLFVLLCPMVMSLLPLVYPELPVSMQYQMKQVFPNVPELWSQLLCFPLEMISWLVALGMAAFGSYAYLIGVELAILFGQFMRKLQLNTAAQYQLVTRTFMCYKVYNAILNVWYKFVAPPIFFMVTATIIIFLYISFRHTELPVYVYCFYPYEASALLFILFETCHDLLSGCAAAEEVVSRLRSRHMKCFSQMSQEDRAIGWRWGKAMRPLILDIGIFTTFDFGVATSVWDEIVNQLVFLLTL